jgi:hypothetical protein
MNIQKRFQSTVAPSLESWVAVALKAGVRALEDA